MSKPLNALATELVGDGRKPNLYFVSDNKGDCIMVTQDAQAAYDKWRELAAMRPLSECNLEDRLTGTICTVEPDEDTNRLHVWDDSAQWLKGKVHA